MPQKTSFLRAALVVVLLLGTIAVAPPAAAGLAVGSGTNPTTLSGIAVRGTVTFTPDTRETLGWYDTRGRTSNGSITWTTDYSNTPGKPLTFSYTYTPDPGFVGTDSHRFGAAGSGDSYYGTYYTETFTVTNRPPVVTGGGGYTTPMNTPITVNGTATDPEGGPTVFVEHTDAPAHGSYADISTTDIGYSFVYQPYTDWHGTDTIFVTYRDNLGATGTATIKVTVLAPPNSAPTAADDDYTTVEDTAVAGNVLDNDTDADDDSLTAALASDPANGYVTLDADGTFTYAPDADWHGTDTFTYSASDGEDSSVGAAVTVTVAPVNDVPVAIDAATVVAEDGVVSGQVDVSDADGDTLSYFVAVAPENGSLLLDLATGEWTYRPSDDFFGTDAFTIEVSDPDDETAESITTIIVNPVNDAPVAADVAVNTAHNTSVTMDLGGHVTDIDSTDLTFDLVHGANDGAITFDGDTGAVTYQPDRRFAGTDTFGYEVCDDGGLCDTATVTVTVAGSPPAWNWPPVARDAAVTTNEDTTTSGTIVVADTGDTTFMFSVTDRPHNGTAAVHATTGVWTYTPGAGFHGTDTFTVRACDTGGLCDTAVVTITVRPSDSAPADDRSPVDRVIDALYADFLDRAPTPAELAAAKDLIARNGRSAFVHSLAYSGEWVQLLVDRYYQDTLGRVGDPDGRAYWINLIQTRRATTAQVAAMFYASAEYFERIGGNTVESWVTDLYRKLLSREPDAAGFSYWTDVARTLGRPAVAESFYQAIEVRRLRVSRLYQDLLGRTPEPAGLSYWAELIGRTGNDVDLAAHLAASDEYHQRSQQRP